MSRPDKRRAQFGRKAQVDLTLWQLNYLRRWLENLDVKVLESELRSLLRLDRDEFVLSPPERVQEDQ